MPKPSNCFLDAEDLLDPNQLKSHCEQKAILKDILREICSDEKVVDGRIKDKNLSFAVLTEVVFHGMNFQGFNFQYSILKDAQFLNCDLRGANFTRANLSGAKFDGSMISANCFQTRWVSLSDGRMPCVADFSKAYLIDQAWYDSLGYLFAKNKGLQQKNEDSLRRLLKTRQALYQMLGAFFINDLSLMVLEYVFTVCHCHRNDMQAPLEKSPEMERSCVIL